MVLEMLLPSISLLMVTVFASYTYYKKILEAQGEYLKSRNIIRDITFGFTRQVKRISGQIVDMENHMQEAYIMAAEAMKSSDKTLKIVENLKIEPNDLNDKISIHEVKIENHSKMIGRQVEILSSYENEIKKLRDEVKILASKPPVRQIIREVDAPIPVDESNIIAQLTGTEMEVLKLIQSMGLSSVPQIKDKIGKTREHTSRLLKKLFDKGFIDRNTSSMPYRYEVRKEVKDLINDQMDVPT